MQLPKSTYWAVSPEWLLDSSFRVFGAVLFFLFSLGRNISTNRILYQDAQSKIIQMIHLSVQSSWAVLSLSYACSLVAPTEELPASRHQASIFMLQTKCFVRHRIWFFKIPEHSTAQMCIWNSDPILKAVTAVNLCIGYSEHLRDCPAADKPKSNSSAFVSETSTNVTLF